jgi:hypothetical protein
MSNFTKDDRERPPREQAGNFIASIGGMLKAGAPESAAAARLADLIIEVAALKNPAGFARDCSRALSEWADVNRVRPDHAYDLAVLASRRTKNQPVKAEEVLRALAVEPARLTGPLQSRKAAAPKGGRP